MSFGKYLGLLGGLGGGMLSGAINPGGGKGGFNPLWLLGGIGGAALGGAFKGGGGGDEQQAPQQAPAMPQMGQAPQMGGQAPQMGGPAPMGQAPTGMFGAGSPQIDPQMLMRYRQMMMGGY